MKKILLLILLLLTYCILHAQWTPDSILNDNNRMCRTGYNGSRGIVSSGNDLYTVWIEEGYEIFLKAKTGGTWTSSERVSVGSPGGLYGISSYPSIAVQAAEIHVVWEDYRTGDFEIFYRKFSNGWGSPSNLSGNPAESHAPVITVSNSGNIYLIWQEYSTGISEIYAKIYSSGSWGATERLSSTTFYAGFPTVAHNGETVYVVWEEMDNNGYELFYSIHSGGTWSSPQRITQDGGLSQFPSICSDPSGNIHLVFMDDRNGSFDIYYSLYTGTSWSTDTCLTGLIAGEALYPQITSDPFGIIHLVWSSNSEGNYDIFHSSRISGVWSAEENITNMEKQSTSPHVACTNDGSIHVLWYDWVDDSVYVSPHIRYKWYDPSLNILSSSFTHEITDSGVLFYADISSPSVYLYRISTPYPVKIPYNTFNGNRYEWFDRLSPGEYTYILQRIEGNDVHYSHQVNITIPQKEDILHFTVSPNPFIEKVEIRLHGVSVNRCIGESVIQIYDISGREVRNFPIPNSQFPIVLTWDGKDSIGRSAPAGIYLIRSNHSMTRTVIKI